MSTTEYVILLHGDPQAWRDATPAERAETMARHDAFSRECAEQGYLITGGSELTDVALATVVRRPSDGGAPVVSEGPFTETVEQLGGFYVIQTDDLDGLVALVAHHLEEHAEFRATVRHDEPDDAATATATAGVSS